MKVVGVTGGIATGKSTVLGMLAALGARTASADDIARKLTGPGAILTGAISYAFPDVILRDPAGILSIDRRALADRIFADDAARKRLEEILHPSIIDHLEEEIERYRVAPDAPILALEIPLLFEAGLEGMVDTVLVVACAEAAQVDRIRARWGVDEARARRMLTAQWPLARKVDAADLVVTTDVSTEEAERQVAHIWRDLV